MPDMRHFQRLQQLSDIPPTHSAIRGRRKERLRLDAVAAALHLQGVHGVSVACGGERRALNRKGLGPRVPRHHLAGVCASEKEMRVGRVEA